MNSREKGSALIASFLMVIILAGMCAALQATSLIVFRAANETIDLQECANAADSGLAYYVSQVELDQDYFATAALPQPPLPLGEGSFQLLDALATGGPGEWVLDLRSTLDGLDYSMRAVIGYRRIVIPHGILVGGSGNPTDVVLTMTGGSGLASYDPTIGTALLNDESALWVNGSMELKGSADVDGDATATGTIATSAGSSISGASTEYGMEIPVDSFEGVAQSYVDSSRASNDNGVLKGIFGPSWRPIKGVENYGDLVVSGGTYVVPPGTYRFRTLQVLAGAKIVFDTSTGPSTIVYTGNGRDTLTVSAGSTLAIAPGGTSNGLMTVLGQDTNFDVSAASVFGQAIGDPYNAGYSQIISAGGTGTVQAIGGSQVFGRLAAPNLDFQIGGGSTWYGAAVAKTVKFFGDGVADPQFLVDEGSMGSYVIDPDHFEVHSRWRQTTAPPTTYQP